MKNKSIQIKNLSKREDLCQLKVGNICIEMIYAENNKSFNECMSNILKLKMK